MLNASKNKKLKGILSINNLPLVSKDFNHNSSQAQFLIQLKHKLSKINFVVFYLGMIMNGDFQIE